MSCPVYTRYEKWKQLRQSLFNKLKDFPNTQTERKQERIVPPSCCLPNSQTKATWWLYLLDSVWSHFLPLAFRRKSVSFYPLVAPHIFVAVVSPWNWIFPYREEMRFRPIQNLKIDWLENANVIWLLGCCFEYIYTIYIQWCPLN